MGVQAELHLFWMLTDYTNHIRLSIPINYIGPHHNFWSDILTFIRLKNLLAFHISIKHIWFAKFFVHITSKSSFEHESVYFLYEIRHSCNVIVEPHLWTIPGSCYKMWPENIKCPFTSVNIFPGIVRIIQIK